MKMLISQKTRVANAKAAAASRLEHRRADVAEHQTWATLTWPQKAEAMAAALAQVKGQDHVDTVLKRNGSAIERLQALSYECGAAGITIGPDGPTAKTSPSKMQTSALPKPAPEPAAPKPQAPAKPETRADVYRALLAKDPKAAGVFYRAHAHHLGTPADESDVPDGKHLLEYRRLASTDPRKAAEYYAKHRNEILD